MEGTEEASRGSSAAKLLPEAAEAPLQERFIVALLSTSVSGDRGAVSLSRMLILLVQSRAFATLLQVPGARGAPRESAADISRGFRAKLLLFRPASRATRVNRVLGKFHVREKGADSRNFRDCRWGVRVTDLAQILRGVGAQGV